VLDGPFRFSRNPMYLGMVTLLIGVAIGLGSATPWLVIPAFFFLISKRFIAAEERKMEVEFGAEYLSYRSKVRRWI
jgi:protein-S-isoprenylcysteine O-methyltransferase Ste14